MPPTVAESRAARSTPNTSAAAVAARCTSASVAPAPTCIRRSTTSTSPTFAQPLGGQQHVVVLGHRPGHQRCPAALHGDVDAGVAAGPQDGGDLVGRSRPYQRAGVPAVAPGVVDTAAVQHVGIGADVRGADDRGEPVGQRFGHLPCGWYHTPSPATGTRPTSTRPVRGRRQVVGQRLRSDDDRRYFALLTATLSRFRLNRNKMPRGTSSGRCGHRDEHHRRLPALELVDGADGDVGQSGRVEHAAAE